MAQSAPHPDSFTAWAFTKVGGQLEKVSLPWKDPQEGQIVVKVLACGVCHSDRYVQQVHLRDVFPVCQAMRLWGMSSPSARA